MKVGAYILIANDELEYVERFTLVRKKGDFLYYPDKNGKRLFELCSDIDIEKIQMDVVTGVVEIHIKYYIDNEYKTIVVDRKDLTCGALMPLLLARGVQITDKTIGILIDYLLYREKLTKITYIHRRIGFVIINNERVFLHNEAFSKSGRIKSSYCGNYVIAPKGCLEGELALVRDEILSFTPLEVAWVIGFSAPLLGILRGMVALDNFVTHSYGKSSSGKTTQALVSLSPFSLPSKNCPNSLFSSWSGTPNAVIGKLSSIIGMPVVFDEAGLMDKKILASILYQMSSGLGKARLSSDSTVREQSQFTVVVISNGEGAILTEGNRNVGLRVRTLQFPNVIWTNSAAHSTRISERILANYGNSGPIFAKSLMEYSDEELLSRFKEAKEYVLSSLLKVDDFSTRSSEKIAIIYLAAKMLNEVFGIGLNEEEILSFLITADENQLESRNLGFMAYQAVKEQVTSNLNKFVFKDNAPGTQIFSGVSGFSELPRNEIWGRLISDSTKTFSEVWILRNKLDQILQESGFVDSEVVLTEWREKGIIDSDKGKYTRKRTLYNNGTAVRVVVLRLKSNAYETLEKEGDETVKSIRSIKGINIREEKPEMIEEDII